jgi:excisionase family DNA binding protein
VRPLPEIKACTGGALSGKRPRPRRNSTAARGTGSGGAASAGRPSRRFGAGGLDASRASPVAAKSRLSSPSSSSAPSVLLAGPKSRFASPTASQAHHRSRPTITKASFPPSPDGRRGRGPGGTRAVRVPPAYDQTAPDASLLLRPAEVATTLGISRSRVFELLAARDLPSVHIGRSTRIPRAQLEEWIDGQLKWEPHQERGLLGRLQGSVGSAHR